MKKLSCLLLLLFPLIIQGQTFQKEIDTIPVTREGQQLQYPWNGGFNTLSIVMPDLDDDGDFDLLMTGGDEGRLHYYRNTTEGIIPDFTLEDSWLSELEFGIHNNRLAVEDLDFDGDVDMLVGENYGKLSYYRNDGSSQDPEFTLVTDLFDSIVIGYQAAPTFADLNGDGLKDLLIGSYDQDIHYFTRNDSMTTGFSLADTLRDPNGGIIVSGATMSAPSFVDIDDDGDLDLFVGSSAERLAFYSNTGSESVPIFNLVDANFIIPPDGMDFLIPVFMDIDNDQDYDLFFGSNHGFVTFYRNEGTKSEPDFVLNSRQLPLEYLDFGFYSCPYFVDINGNGTKDLFVSNIAGELHYFQNEGTTQQPSFNWITERFEGVIAPGATQAWADLDNDDDYDLLFSGFNGPVYYYKNTGTINAAQLDSVGILLDSLGNQIEGRRPELTDLNGDDKPDLFMNIRYDSDNAILMYQNVGDPDSAVFILTDTLREENGEVLSFFDGYFRFTDFDGDDSLDFFTSSGYGILHYKNIGSPDLPRFRLLKSFFAGVVPNQGRHLPFFTDIDDDGYMDLFLGRFRGGLLYYHNTTALSLIEGNELIVDNFILRQNYPNPFNPVTTINYELPTTNYVELSIYNLLGQKVVTLISEKQNAGFYQVEWDASAFASGIYYYSIKAGKFQDVKKMVLIR